MAINESSHAVVDVLQCQQILSDCFDVDISYKFLFKSNCIKTNPPKNNKQKKPLQISPIIFNTDIKLWL